MLRVSIANPYEYPLEFQQLKDAARAVFEGEGVAACKVTLAFVDNSHIHRLNKQFLQHDEPTDVLTFPYTDAKAKTLEGEVAIGYEVAKEYAADRGHDANLELLLYVVHGCLHLCGYDDTDDAGAAEMRKKEREYLTKLGLPDIAGT
jgi:probable rRNA maturation factor